jgi:HPt (histidine-containing phosphotransfer) domain-containing protein
MTNEEKIAALRQVEGLDTDAGLKVIANMIPAYLRILGLFAKNYERDKAELDTDDTEAFRTTVHGYKSGLAGIGALGLSEMACGLEEAAKSGDRGYIDANLPEFKAAVSAFSAKITEVLG